MGAPPVVEAWLSGPPEGVAPELAPAGHALIQARSDLAGAASDASRDELWERPGGAASAGYHLRHMAGSLDRLLTYARGERLTEAQRASLAAEGESRGSAAELVAHASAAIDRALEQIRATDPGTLLDHRTVGRAALPTNVLGLLFHAAEHTARHTGQLITTLKVVRGARRAEAAR